ncbi:MAG: zinc ABC transporter substrate-binding protein [Thermodesulfobacteriota bacterium]
MRKCLIHIVCVALIVALSSHSSASDAEPGGRIKVFVSIVPQAYFVERIGGPHVEVKVLVGPGMDVHTFEPSPRTVTDLAKARILFRIGLPYEDVLVAKIGSTFKNLEVVDTRRGIPLRETEEGEEAHGHGEASHNAKEADHHGKGEKDPHIWLAPRLVKIQAENMCRALQRIDPARAEEYAKNLGAFLADLDTLDAELSQALAPVRGKTFFVFHSAFGYFADAYGLKQEAVETGGKEPSARRLAKLITQAKEDGVRVIFVQPQFSQKSSEALASAIGGAVVPVDDLARDYLANMKSIAEKVRTALSKQAK